MVLRRKRARILHEMLIHLVLIGILFVVFFAAISERMDSRGIRQQVLEKQTAINLEVAVPGMSFEIEKANIYGYVELVELKGGRVYISVEGLPSLKGYPFFSPYSVDVLEEETKFVISVT